MALRARYLMGRFHLKGLTCVSSNLHCSPRTWLQPQPHCLWGCQGHMEHSW